MKRGQYAFLILALLIIVAAGSKAYAALYDCDISSTACAALYVNVGNITDDGHFVNNSAETQRLCCRAVSVGGGVSSFKYSDDGHISVNSTVTNFPNNMYLGFVRNCSLKTSCDAANNEICIFKVLNSTIYTADNSHVWDCDDASADKEKLCCPFTEFCNNGLDDDFDGYIDCVDTDCHATPQVCTGSPYNSSTCVQLERNTITGLDTITYNPLCNDSSNNKYYCSYPASGAPTGVCCGAGTVAMDDGLGHWQCVDSEECGLTSMKPITPCDYDFDDSRNSWLSNPYDGSSDWCVSRMPNLLDPFTSEKRSTGCCLIVKDGVVDYYTDDSNVKIFGTS